MNENKSRIELFLLPGYSPVRNPDELLNQELKATVFRNKRPTNKKELKILLRQRLCQIHKIFYFHLLVRTIGQNAGLIPVQGHAPSKTLIPPKTPSWSKIRIAVVPTDSSNSNFRP